MNAEMWLHGSCARITEGLCGNWNGNPEDDITLGGANAHGEQFKKYDEHCPAPPPPPNYCRKEGVAEWVEEEADRICSILKGRQKREQNDDSNSVAICSLSDDKLDNIINRKLVFHFRLNNLLGLH